MTTTGLKLRELERPRAQGGAQFNLWLWCVRSAGRDKICSHYLHTVGSIIRVFPNECPTEAKFQKSRIFFCFLQYPVTGEMG